MVGNSLGELDGRMLDEGDRLGILLGFCEADGDCVGIGVGASVGILDGR
jgi:hypothetical protein